MSGNQKPSLHEVLAAMRGIQATRVRGVGAQASFAEIEDGLLVSEVRNKASNASSVNEGRIQNECAIKLLGHIERQILPNLKVGEAAEHINDMLLRESIGAKRPVAALEDLLDVGTYCVYGDYIPPRKSDVVPWAPEVYWKFVSPALRQ